jgi:hypothetical protein
MQCRDDSLSIRHEPSPLGPLPDRCQLPPVDPAPMVEKVPTQPNAHGLPREAYSIELILSALEYA